MKNLIIRTLTGLAYLVVMVGCLLLSKYFFLVVMLLVVTMMMHEFHKMNMNGAYPVQQVLSVLTGLSIFILFFCHMAYGIDSKYILLSFIPMFALMVSFFGIKDREQFTKVSHLFTSILYIAVPMSMFNLLVFRNYSFDGTILLCYFIIVWMSDVGAYCFGMALGQKYGPKLCPNISPKKSWIGVGGGIAASVGTGAALSALGYLPYGMGHCIAIAAVICVTGICGDLIESVWKRVNGIKDSGNCIPGHGGMMDRFDSSMVAIPSAVIYMIIFGLL